MTYTGLKAELADRLFAIGAIKLGAFRLKLHQKHPDAPLSPIFINLRTSDNPKPGPLTPDVLSLIGKVLAEAVRSGSVGDFDRITPIPNAGDPLAEALAAQLGDVIPILLLLKEESADGRRIAGVASDEDFDDGDIVLLVDDLITQADTKLEAIQVIREARLVVNALLLLVDRMQGGRGQVEALGLTVHAIYQLDELLDHYVSRGFITDDKAAEVMDYIAANSVA